MKVMGIREARSTFGDCLDEAQRRRILITRNGRPAALLIGVEGEELEDVFTQSDPAFWRMIEERRRAGRKHLSLDEVRERLGVERAPSKPSARSRRKAVGRPKRD